MDLAVKQDGESIMFAVPANEASQLADRTSLGTICPGSESTLDITLDVPITMGNAFQVEAGYVDWQLNAKELPVEPTDSSSAQTRDDFSISLRIGSMELALPDTKVKTPPLTAAGHNNKSRHPCVYM